MSYTEPYTDYFGDWTFIWSTLDEGLLSVSISTEKAPVYDLEGAVQLPLADVSRVQPALPVHCKSRSLGVPEHNFFKNISVNVSLETISLFALDKKCHLVHPMKIGSQLEFEKIFHKGHDWDDIQIANWRITN